LKINYIDIMSLKILEALLSYLKKGYSLSQSLGHLSEDVTFKKSKNYLKKTLKDLHNGVLFQTILDKDLRPYLLFSINDIPNIPKLSLFIEHLIELMQLKKNIKKQSIKSLSYPLFLLTSTAIAIQIMVEFSTQTQEIPLSIKLTALILCTSTALLLYSLISRYKKQQKNYTWVWTIGVLIKSGLSVQKSLTQGCLLSKSLPLSTNTQT
jgi:type II secretory pathway component PulF